MALDEVPLPRIRPARPASVSQADAPPIPRIRPSRPAPAPQADDGQGDLFDPSRYGDPVEPPAKAATGFDPSAYGEPVQQPNQRPIVAERPGEPAPQKELPSYADKSVKPIAPRMLGPLDPTAPPTPEGDAPASGGTAVGQFLTQVPGGAVALVGSGVSGLSALEDLPDVGDAALPLKPDFLRVPKMSEPEFNGFLERIQKTAPSGAQQYLIDMARDLRRGAITTDEVDGFIQPTKVRPFAERPLYQAGEAIKDFGEKTFPVAPGWENAWSTQLGQGLGSVIGGGLVTMIPGVGQALGGALFVGSGMDQALQGAMQEAEGPGGMVMTNMPGRPVSVEQQQEAALKGAVPGATDIIPLEIMLHRLGVPPGAGAKLIHVIGDAAKKIGTQAAIEGFQEGFQQFLQNAIAQGYKPEQSLTEGVPENAAIGAAVGGLVSGAIEAGNATLENRVRGGDQPAAGGPIGGAPSPSTEPPEQVSPDEFLKRADQYSPKPEAAAPQADPGPPPWASQPDAASKPGDVTYRILRDAGYSNAEIAKMDERTASMAAIKARANGGKRADAAPEPPPAAGAAPGSTVDDDKDILRAAGWDDVSIDDMSPTELAAEAQRAREQGVQQPPRRPRPQAEAAPEPPPSEPQGASKAPPSTSGAPPARVRSEDEAFAAAPAVIEGQEAVGASFLQRKLGLSYGAAVRVLDRLEKAGRIGPMAKGGQHPVVKVGNKAPGEAVTPASLPAPAGQAVERNAGQIAPEPSKTTEPTLENVADGLKAIFNPAEFGVPAGTRGAVVPVETPEQLAAATKVAAEPTPGQAKAGNYQHGHIKIHGLDVAIETPKGGIRRSKDENAPWEVEMPAAYGYVKSSPNVGDGKLDVFVGDEPRSKKAFIVDQFSLETGRFDEPKVILGVRSKREAEALYDASYSDGRGGDRRGITTGISVEKLKAWIASGASGNPYSPEARRIERSRIQDLAKHKGSLPKSEQSALPQLRGQGDNSASGVAEVPGVFGRSGAAAVSERDIGKNGQRRLLRAGERPVGDSERAGAKSAKEPASNSRGGDEAAGGVGRGRRTSTVNNSLSTENGNVGRGRGADAGKRGATPRPVSIVPFLKSRGGLKEQNGELKHLGLPRAHPGLMNNRKGLTHDYAREAAAEAGYFDHKYGSRERAVAESTPADLLELVHDELMGQKHYSADDHQALGDQRQTEDRSRNEDARARAVDRAREDAKADLAEAGVTDVDPALLDRTAELMVDEEWTAEAAFERAVMEGEAEELPAATVEELDHALPPGWETEDVADQSESHEGGREAGLDGEGAEARGRSDDVEEVREGAPSGGEAEGARGRSAEVEEGGETLSGFLDHMEAEAAAGRWSADLAPTPSVEEFNRALEARGWKPTKIGKGDFLVSPDGKTQAFARSSGEGNNNVIAQWGSHLPTEEGADGKPQTFIPGAEKVGTKEVLERRAQQPKVSKVQQDFSPIFKPLEPEAKQESFGNLLDQPTPATKPAAEQSAEDEFDQLFAGALDEQFQLAKPLDKLELLNGQVAEEARGNSARYDDLLNARADEARNLIAEARKEGLTLGQTAYVDGIERRLDTATAAKNAVKNVAMGLADVAKGLDALFSPKGKLGSGPTFDPETYEKAKPFFRAGMKHFAQAGRDLGTMVRELVRYLAETAKMSREAIEAMKPYIRRFLDDIQAGKEDFDAPGTSSRVERDSGEPAARDDVGSTDVPASGERAGGGPRQGGDPALERNRISASGERLPEVYAPLVGADGHIELPAREPEPGRGTPVAGRPERSGDDGFGGLFADRTPGEEAARSTGRRAEVEARRRAQRAAEDSTAALNGGIGNVRETLPMLTPPQQEDVVKVESRFFGQKKPGMLLTNGTGTGKTYSGLGVVKRFTKAGKGQILVVAPSQGILLDWKRSATDLMLDAHILDGLDDGGRKGLNLTTYANLGQNENLASHNWDLVVADEAHKLSSDQDGTTTNALQTFRALTMHPSGYERRAQMVLRDKWAAVQRINRKDRPEEYDRAYRIFRSHADDLIAEWKRTYGPNPDAIGTGRGFASQERPKALMMSATPFAYHFSLDYAEGYLFDYGPEPKNRGAYNAPDSRGAWYMENLGYRMRTGKLTAPEADVNLDVMERQLHEKLKREGALSGRALELPTDYDRKFVIVHDAVGNDIDKALTFLQEAENGRYRRIYDFVNKSFDYLRRMRLLEAIKARSVIPLIRENLARGRKVVVFHDYNEGGGSSPFELDFPEDDLTVWYPNGVSNPKTEPTNGIYADFLAKNPYVSALKFDEYGPPLVALKSAFPDALIYNGTVSVKDRDAAKKLFNDDTSGRDLIIVQSAAGEFGISLHDTTGDHARILYNLGMPIRPTSSTQQEGRIRREGSVTDAMFRYLNTGTNWERWTFAGKIAERAGTAENLAMGEQARAIRQSFVEAFENADDYPVGHEGEGKGGKAADRSINNNVSEFERAKAHYFAGAKNTKSRGNREGIDYFATPEPLGFKMVEWANVKPGEKILEPSAGHGAISRYFPEDTARTIVEPSTELASKASLRTPGARVVVGRFEDLNVGANKFHAIVMNPPFGHGGKTAIDHLGKAVAHLANGGRIVALIPRGQATERFDKFMEDDSRSRGVYLVGRIVLPSVTFERAGTSVAAQVVILEKQTDREIAAKMPQERLRDYTSAETIKEFFDRIENVDMPPRTEPVTKEVIEDEPAADGTGTDVTAGGVALKIFNRPLDTNGRVQHGARFVKKEPREVFARVARAADAAGGRYSKVMKEFHFPDAAHRQDFLDKLSEAGKPAEEATVGRRQDFDLGETIHGKTGKPVYVASIRDRVERDVYEQILAVAKKHGGYYSSYTGRGAIPGFQFATADARAAFIAEAGKPPEGPGGGARTLGASSQSGASATAGATIQRHDGGWAAVDPTYGVPANDTVYPTRAAAERAVGNKRLEPAAVPPPPADLENLKNDLQAMVARAVGRRVKVSFIDRMPEGFQPSEGVGGITEGTRYSAYYEYDPAMPARSLIVVALGEPGMADPAVAGPITAHEIWHDIEAFLLSKEEREFIDKDFARGKESSLRKLAAEAWSTTVDDPRIADMKRIEATAYAYQGYRMRQDRGEDAGRGIHIAIRRLFHKLAGLFDAVRRFLTRRGIRSIDDLFAKVDRGDFAKRDPKYGYDEATGERTLGAARPGNAGGPGAPPPGGPAAPANQSPPQRQRIARLMQRMGVDPDGIRIRLQDKALPWLRVQEDIEEAIGQKLATPINVYQAEALYHGRAGEQTDDLRTQRVEPIVQAMQSNDINLDELDEYLTARHAAERNAVIRNRDPQNNEGSGMSDADAAAHLAAVHGGPKAQAFRDLGRMVDELNMASRRMMLDSGLISVDQFNEWNAMYKHYVPLRGFDGVESEDGPRTGRGFDIRGKEAKTAFGRRSRADSPLIYSIMQAEQTIVRAEKNRVLKTVLRLVNAHPDPDTWVIYKGQKRKYLDDNTGLVMEYWEPAHVAANRPELREQMFAVKIGGKATFIQIKDKRLARSLRGVGQSAYSEPVVRALMGAARVFSAMQTQWNPEFVLTNVVKDVQTALINISDIEERPAAVRRQIVKDILTTKSLRGILKAMADPNSQHEYAKWFEEFRHAGGKISFLQWNDVETIRAQIEADLTAGRTSKAVRSGFRKLANLNTAVENATRLAAYVALRKAGVNTDRAAFVARELTTNFNRRGEWGPWLNILYPFYNASTQGTARYLGRIIKSKVTRRIVMGLFLSGFMLDWLQSLLSAEDDDGNNLYDAIPDWITSRNLVIMIPFDKRGRYLQIPMAWGYSFFVSTGMSLSKLLRGARKPGATASNLVSSALDSFNPLGSAASLLQFVSPTILDPVAQMYEGPQGVTWYGGPVYPRSYDEKKPDSERAFANTPQIYKDVARFLNAIGGGTVGKPGWQWINEAGDVSPESIQLMTEFLTGGIGRFVANNFKTGARLFSGGEVLPEDIPFARRFMGSVTTTTARRNQFYDAWDTVDGLVYEMKALRKAGQNHEADQLMKDNQKEFAAYGQLRAVYYTLNNLQKKRTAIRAGNAPNKDELLKGVDAEERAALAAARKAYPGGS